MKHDADSIVYCHSSNTVKALRPALELGYYCTVSEMAEIVMIVSVVIDCSEQFVVDRSRVLVQVS